MENKVYFENSKGDKLCALLIEPEEKTDRVVLFFHGFSSSKTFKKARLSTPKLLEMGISVLSVDYSGHGESEGAFADVKLTQGVDVVNCAIEYAKSKGYSRICVVGSSWGGVTSTIAVSKRDDVELLVLMSPATDFAEVWELLIGKDGIAKWKETGITDYVTGLGKKCPLKYSFYEDIEKYNTIELAKDIKVKTLVIHGNADKIVPIQQSKALVDSMGSNAMLEELDGCGHGNSSEECLNKVINLTIDFITNNFK